MKDVKRHISWIELFGERRGDMADDVRRSRWEEWKKLCNDAGETDIVEQWTEPSMAENCSSCVHCDKDWCNASGLPCTVNPILTFQFSMLGMACMGTGHKPKQTTINFDA